VPLLEAMILEPIIDFIIESAPRVSHSTDLKALSSRLLKPPVNVTCPAFLYKVCNQVFDNTHSVSVSPGKVGVRIRKHEDRKICLWYLRNKNVFIRPANKRNSSKPMY
jgi:hypothetical protein